MRRSPLGILGAAGVVVGCAGMVSMLPGAAVGVLGAVGITGSSAVATVLTPVAEPIYIISALLILVSALTCSRVVALLTAAGAALLYLSMFQLAGNGRSAGAGSMSMSAMQRHPELFQADPPTFYIGLTLLLAAVILRFWRRRAHQCRPLLRISGVRIRYR